VEKEKFYGRGLFGIKIETVYIQDTLQAGAAWQACAAFQTVLSRGIDRRMDTQMRREEKTEIMEGLKGGFYWMLRDNFLTRFFPQGRHTASVSHFRSMSVGFCKIWRLTSRTEGKIIHRSKELVLLLTKIL
jgi:hypothetical protein